MLSEVRDSPAPRARPSLLRQTSDAVFNDSEHFVSRNPNHGLFFGRQTECGGSRAYRNLQKQSIVWRTLTSTCLALSAGGTGTIAES